MAIDAEILQAALIGYQSERERITKVIADLRSRLKSGKAPESSGLDGAGTSRKPRRKLSAAARRRMAAAQKKRWANYHKGHK